MTVALGIVGCGRFVHHYHLPALRRNPGVTLVGVCDPSPSSATVELVRQTGAVLVDKVGDLLDLVHPDAVLVSSPHALHAPHASMCIKAGAHVLVDKPFTVHTADAVQLAEQANAAGLVGAVAFNRRFDAGFRHARSVVASGQLGQLVHVESIQLGYPTEGWYSNPRLSGGGPFVGRGAHMADIVPWTTRRAVRAVMAHLVPVTDVGSVDRGGFVDADLGGLSWHATVLAGDPWNLDELRIFGTEGSVVVRRPANQTFSWISEHRDLDDGIIGRSELGQEGMALDDFLTAITGSDPPACSFSEAATSVAVIEAAFSAARDGGISLPVEAPCAPPPWETRSSDAPPVPTERGRS